MTTPVAARNPALPAQAAPLPVQEATPPPPMHRAPVETGPLASRAVPQEAGAMAPRQSLAARQGGAQASSSGAAARATESAVQRQAHALFERARKALLDRVALSSGQFSDIVALAVDSRMGEAERRALAEALAGHPRGLSALYSLEKMEGATVEALSIVAAAVAGRHRFDLEKRRIPELLALPEPVRLAVALAQQALDAKNMQFHGRHRSGFYQLDLAPASHSRMFAQAMRLFVPLATREELARLVGEEFQRWKPVWGSFTEMTHSDPAVRLHALQKILAGMQLQPVLQRVVDGDPIHRGAQARATHQQWALEAAVMFGGLPPSGLAALEGSLQSLARLHAPLLRRQLTERLALPAHAGDDARDYLQFSVPFHRPHMRSLAIALYPLFASPARPPAELLKILGSSDLKNSHWLHRALKDLLLLADSECDLSHEERRQLLEHALPPGATVSPCRGFLDNLRSIAIAVQCATGEDAQSSMVLDKLTDLARSPDRPASIKDAIAPVLRLAMPGVGAQDAGPESLVAWKAFLSSWRQPEALIVHAQNIRSNLDEDEGKEAVLNALNGFADSAVWSRDGLAQFRAMRYATNASPHLAEIEKQAPEAYAQWKKPAVLETVAQAFAVEDTDHPEDLLLCGTDVASCQSVNDDAMRSKALMGYVIDGKYRMLMARAPDGTIAARRMVRLLLDEATGRPVLYVEKLYANTGIEADSPADKALVQLARCKADAMGCALVCAASGSNEEDETLPAYEGLLKSLGSPAPFEYVDADHIDADDEEQDEGGVVKGGRYTVENAYRLQ
ncbi:hypothetical protein [Acidovorax sp. SUPP2539]|uniref:hypothetical protein n=1 Tax=Acidovorax sp. SUPP2539 TaxID=2920878 RepID=UPI0023DE30D8|nr:hypothetical protein [Acidovorax sp. SUPP2539]GKS89643.1 hypothetical protein AVTE2539_09780 [Acidovorax sp. SUPP2539]